MDGKTVKLENGLEVCCGAVEKVGEGPEKVRYLFSWERLDDLQDADDSESEEPDSDAESDPDDDHSSGRVPELRRGQ